MDHARTTSTPLASFPAQLAIVAGGGLAVGVLTSLAQGLLPDTIGSVANSAGAWSLAAFLLCLSCRTPWRGAMLGALALAAMVIGYGLAANVRGIPTGRSLWLLWGVAAVIVGPVLGVGATWVRAGDGRQAAAGVAAIAGILAGEGAYGLTRIADTTSPVYWTLQAVVGVAIVVFVARMRALTRRDIATCLILTVIVAVAFVVVYGSGLGSQAA